MIQLKVNGVAQSFDGDPEMPLLWYLRDILGLTGTKFGCGIALCGACTVHKNGEALRSCITPMNSLAGAEIRTIEDISTNGLHPVQRMWMQFNVPRVLPIGTDYAGCRAAEGQAQAHRPGYRGRHGCQHLPLRNVSTHSRRH